MSYAPVGMCFCHACTCDGDCRDCRDQRWAEEEAEANE